jgi:DNA-binding IclR family transcriptional regulator
VLDAFEAGPGALTLVELSERTGLYKSTILRIAETLAARGCRVREADGTCQIGPKPFLLGARYQSSVIPAERVLPVLRKLVGLTGESASFNVRNGDHRVCLLRIRARHARKTSFWAHVNDTRRDRRDRHDVEGDE